MAVLKNDRKLSKCEYEYRFKVLYRFAKENLCKIPKRRQNWLAVPIHKLLNSAYVSIMELNTAYIKNKEERDNKFYYSIKHSIDCLIKLQNPLYSYWNIMCIDLKHRKSWCDTINHELNLLYGMLKANSFYNEKYDGDFKYIMYYTYEEINNANFLYKMSELHRYTHTKAINAKRIYDAQESALLIELVNDAWYHCIEANKKVPENREEFTIRQNHISDAISCLRKMNRPLISLFNLMQYSERIMREWSDLLNDELALLSGLRKSDNERFKYLK